MPMANRADHIRFPVSVARDGCTAPMPRKVGAKMGKMWWVWLICLVLGAPVEAASENPAENKAPAETLATDSRMATLNVMVHPNGPVEGVPGSFPAAPCNEGCCHTPTCQESCCHRIWE